MRWSSARRRSRTWETYRVASRARYALKSRIKLASLIDKGGDDVEDKVDSWETCWEGALDELDCLDRELEAALSKEAAVDKTYADLRAKEQSLKT